VTINAIEVIVIALEISFILLVVMNLKSIDLNLLISFDVLVAERNVSRAADRLGMTQSALSHALKRLRILFNDPLLYRGPRGMEPTARALTLKPQVEAVLSNIQSIISTKIVFDPASTTRTFKLSMSDALTVEALPHLVQYLRKFAPNIDLRITTSGPRDACARVIADEIELAIGVFPTMPAELSGIRLFDDSLVCVADKEHSKLRNGQMDENAYFSCPHLTVGQSFDVGVQLDAIFTAMGLPRRIMVSVPHYLAVPALVRGTDLIAHTRRRIVEMFRIAGDLVVFPLPVPVRIPGLSFQQIWHSRYEGDPGHRWLRDVIKRTLGN
jgi:DNA-binding transcriptional LysR family regulator